MIHRRLMPSSTPKRFSIAFFVVSAFSCLTASETGTIKGTVTDNGVPIKGATVRILRNGYSGISTNSATLVGVVVTRRFAFGAAISYPIDAPGMYSVKPNKQGRYMHAGLPIGTYSMWVESNGSIVEQVSGVEVKPGKTGTQQDFDVSRDRLATSNSR